MCCSPDVVVFMDLNLQKCICLTEPSVVQCLRMEFSRQYLEAPVFFSLASDAHSFEQAMAFGNQLLDNETEACYMRAQPPVSKFIDMEMIGRYAPQALAALETMPGLADYMQAWLTAPYEFYFSEDGLMDFVRTGRIVDVDASPDRAAAPGSPPGTAAADAHSLREQHRCAAHRQCRSLSPTLTLR